MSPFLRNIIRFILFIFLQAFVLNKIPPLHQFIKPYIYFLFILWLPFGTSRSLLMFVAFFFGLTMDYFTGTPGWHAAPCVLIAYLRPFLLNVLIPQDTAEVNYAEPGFKSMGVAPYTVYVFILTFIHHAYLVLIQWLQFGNFFFFIGKVAGTTAISMLLVFITELLFVRKARARVNAA
ncbi:MAG: Rod shape-determining protein MreD [Chitinophagaceae bacterium]|nr:Rod shape-determining protein MreD [Chitinophagaceae bacterium]